MWWFWLEFRKQKRGAESPFIYTPACCQWSFNDNEQRQNVGCRMGTLCSVKTAKNQGNKLLTLLWAGAAGAGRALKNKAAAENNSRFQEPPLGTFLLDPEFLFSLTYWNDLLQYSVNSAFGNGWSQLCFQNPWMCRQVAVFLEYAGTFRPLSGTNGHLHILREAAWHGIFKT